MFKVGMIVTGDSFYDRSASLKKISMYLGINQHFMIKAPRRYGKSSLVEQALLIDNDKIYISLNLQSYPNIEVLTDSILNKFYVSFKIKGFIDKTKNAVIDLINEIKIALKIDMDFIKLSLEIADKKNTNEAQRLLQSLDLIQNFAKKKNINIVIFFDEFQDILNMNKDILDQLRATMQLHKNITYIFAGSIERIMNKIFIDNNSSFYKFCRIMELEAFDIKEISLEIFELFKSKNISINKKDIDFILEKLKGHPYNTAKTMQEIYFIALDKKITKITRGDIIQGYSNAYEETKKLIISDLEKTKSYQGLYALIYNLAKENEITLSSASKYILLRKLEDMALIKKRARSDYYIPDGFMLDYLRKID